eukprot:Nk52_evm24s485 gene=Nk52_evmTU24s485
MVAFNYASGVILCLGGAMGFVKKSSIPSLIGGMASGLLLIYSGYVISNGNALTGHSIAAGTGAMLSMMMMPRFINSGKFMPTGVVSMIAVGVTIYNGIKLEALVTK